MSPLKSTFHLSFLIGNWGLLHKELKEITTLTTKKEQHILHMTIHLDEVEMGVKMLLDEFRRISIPKENSALQKILEKTVLHK